MIDSQPDEELLSLPFNQYHQPPFYQSTPLHQQHPQYSHNMYRQPHQQVYGNHPRYANPVPALSSASHYGTMSPTHHHMVPSNQQHPNSHVNHSATASPLPVHTLSSIPHSSSAYTTAPPSEFVKQEGASSPLQPRAPPNLFMDQFTSPTDPDGTTKTRTNSTTQQPFGYVPSIASTGPVHSDVKPRRRRGTTVKRSLEELIIDSNIPTATTMGALPPHRPGPTVGLLSVPLPPSNGMMSPHMAGPTLPLSLPEPPLASATPSNPAALKGDNVSRPKKKSKYTAAQDSLILRLKKEGCSWSDISKAAQCGNSIAARNRYQVLIGQQGGGAVVWETEDSARLKEMLEAGERTKWQFIASELSRVRNKKATAEACQRKIRDLFEENPANFGIVLNAPVIMPPFGGYAPMGGMNGGSMLSGAAPGSEFHDIMGNPSGHQQPFMANGGLMGDYLRR